MFQLHQNDMDIHTIDRFINGGDTRRLNELHST